MITLIRSLQIVIHLPLIRILVPSNVNMVFSVVIPIVMFDIMETEYTSELFLEFDYEQ